MVGRVRHRTAQVILLMGEHDGPVRMDVLDESIAKGRGANRVQRYVLRVVDLVRLSRDSKGEHCHQASDEREQLLHHSNLPQSPNLPTRHPAHVTRPCPQASIPLPGATAEGIAV